VILGCSGDKVDTQEKFVKKYNLNFPLLSDPDFKAIEPYGARRMKQFLGKSFL
jgi:thioredoxin-dependent peroxiredoxin